jgi:hypothetical protein
VEAGAGRRRQNAKTKDAARTYVPAASERKRAPPLSSTANVSGIPNTVEHTGTASNSDFTNALPGDQRVHHERVQGATPIHVQDCAAAAGGSAEPLKPNIRSGLGTSDGLVRSPLAESISTALHQRPR